MNNMQDIFSKDEVSNIQKTMKGLNGTMLDDYKKGVKSLILERQKKNSTNLGKDPTLEQKPTLGADPMIEQKVMEHKQRVGVGYDPTIPQARMDNKQKEGMGDDPMILQKQYLDSQKLKQKQYLDSQKLKQTQDFQLGQRFGADTIGANRPTNISPKNSYDAVSPLEQDTIGGYSIGGPNGETVRKNSRGQYYYINKAGNAVIVNNTLNNTLKNM